MTVVSRNIRLTEIGVLVALILTLFWWSSTILQRRWKVKVLAAIDESW